MKIVYLTAGAAGMFCGSCMHDNALARAMRELGADCVLQPLYTPIRTDGESIASKRLFFGGIHIYLLQTFSLFRWVPSPIRRLLDQRRFLDWATRRASSTDAAVLGDLSISMLRGEHGAQRDEVQRMVTWLRDDMKPDAIIFSNLLIGGVIPRIREELPSSKIIVVLQGDDIFIDHLPPSQRAAVISELSKLDKYCDNFVVNTDFYGKKMAAILGLDVARICVLPLSIDTAPFIAQTNPPRGDSENVAIGSLARIAPEKGFHHLVSAFIELARRPGCEHVTLRAAGWLGVQHHAYKETQEQRITQAGLADRYEYIGSPDLAGKIAFLQSIDVLSVPTDYEEPKGLFILEAMAAGVPVVQPAIGAFPELIEMTGGGLLIKGSPKDATLLADGLETLIKDPALRKALGTAARDAVLRNHTTEIQAKRMLELL